MSYIAHKKQALAHRAFMSDGYKRGILLMGRQCLSPDTLIRTESGDYKAVSDIEIGEKIISHNGSKWEYKPVTDKKHYGVEVEPKPMLEYMIYDQKIKTTYDHPFFYRGHYIPIYQLAWREMEASQRQKLELLCKQYGQTIDYEALQLVTDGSYEALARWERLSQDSSRRQDYQAAQTSSTDLATKSEKPGNSKSQKRHKDRQPSRESGMDDSSRQHNSQSPNRNSGQQTGRKLRNSYPKGISSFENTPRQTPKTPDSEGIRGFLVHNPRYSTQANLVTHIRVSECSETYSIEVAENYNYGITQADILVANSGKTYFATNHAWISAVLNQGRYFVVFKTYKQAHEVVWRQYVPLIPKELIYKKNEQDLLIELNYVQNTPIKLPGGATTVINHDTNLPRSTIQLLGSDQSDSHRGFKANGIIFDEYADQSPDNWDAVYEPMFTTTDGWAIFMGTPRGYNHFYDLIQLRKEDPTWFYQEATWRDSPYVSEEHMARARRDAEKKGALSTFLQEYELEFRSVQGAVYPMFDRKVHVITPSEVPEDLTYYGAIDFGWHTTAFLLCGVDKDQTWYIVDEVYGKEETLDNLIPRIKAKIGDKRIVLMVGDSANRDAIEVMQRDFPIVGINKASDAKGYATGIALVTQKLKPRMQLVGPPKPQMFVSSVCKNFIIEMESYRFPEDKPERNPSDIPVKENDHGPDAWRYLLLHLKFGVSKDTKLPETYLKKQLNQYDLI